MNEQRAEKLLKNADDLVEDLSEAMEEASYTFMRHVENKVDYSDLPAVYTAIRIYQERIASLVGMMNIVLDCIESSMEEIDDAIYAQRNKEMECTPT